MRKILFLLPVVALGGCQSIGSITPSEGAALACLATQAGAQIAATHASPVLSAQVQSDGNVLCTFVTGASVVVAPK